MDITAFEYFRKFGKHLELGECPQREVLITRPDNSTIVKRETWSVRSPPLLLPPFPPPKLTTIVKPATWSL